MSNELCHRNLEPRVTARRRAIPSISKSREEEIRKILRSNLQKTRQRVSDTVVVSSSQLEQIWSLSSFISTLSALSFAPTAGTT